MYTKYILEASIISMDVDGMEGEDGRRSGWKSRICLFSLGHQSCLRFYAKGLKAVKWVGQNGAGGKGAGGWGSLSGYTSDSSGASLFSEPQTYQIHGAGHHGTHCPTCSTVTHS